MRRWLLAPATFWLPLYLLFFFALVLASGLTADEGEDQLIIPWSLLLTLHLGTIALTIALLVVYVRDAYSNPALPDDRRTFWAVVLFLGNAIAMPIYWWLYMRPTSGSSAGRADPLAEG